MAEPLVFDSEEAMRRIDGDKELLTELVGIFFEEYPALLQNIKEGKERADGKKIQESAHSIKSALGNIGAMKAYAIAQVIEMNGKQSRLEPIEMNLRTLEDEVAKYKAAVEQFK